MVRRVETIISLPTDGAGMVAARNRLAKQLGASPALVVFLMALENRVDAIEERLGHIEAAILQLAGR